MNTSPLKAMFWKECRENARWAALSAAALSLGLAYAWFHLFQQSSWPSFSNVWSSENLVLTITTPLVALALGLLQVLPELRRDQWAFLVHRPASRTTLFFGKALAGVCLYLLATVLPLLGLAAWASSPSHVPAPFDFRFTLAGWASVLAGLPFYFAGLLVALRPARWYGSRALPLLTALLAPWQASSRTEFWQTALISLLVLAPLFCAAWGSFLSGGEYKEQTKPARFALGMALYPAVVAGSLAALLLLIGIYSALNHNPQQEWWRNDEKMDTQGRVYLTSERTDNQGRTTQTKVTDLAGRPVDLLVWGNLFVQHKFIMMAPLSVTNTAIREDNGYGDPARYVLDVSRNEGGPQSTHSYYAERLRQIVYYTNDAAFSHLSGYLGPNGFFQDSARAGQFEDAMPTLSHFPGQQLLQFPHSVYWGINTAHLLQSAPGGAVVTGTTIVDASTQEGVYYWDRETYLVAADGQVTVHSQSKAGANPEMRTLFTTPLAFDPKSYSDLRVALAPDKRRFFFWYNTPNGSKPSHIVTIAADSGRVLKTETLGPPPSVAMAQAPSFIQGLPALFAPPAGMATTAIGAAISYVLKDDGAHAWWRGFDSGGLLLAVSFFSALGGLVAAVPAWLISRRLGDGRRGQIAWALGGFLLGGYGVLLLLALRAWPARVPCPNCGRQRVVDNEACEHCGALFARPKRDGTEIFDAEGQEVAAR